MLLKIEGDHIEVVKEHQHHDEPYICKDMRRVKDELEGFLEYTRLEEEHQKNHPGAAPRYKVPRMQECQHLLLALDDFITSLHGMMTDEEKAEYKKWKAGLEA